MSKPSSSSGQPIPIGILVSESGQASKSNRPPPKRKSASAANQLPWLWIATGGCAAWIVIVLVIAATSMSREPEAAAKPDMAALAKLGAVEPAFQAPAMVGQDAIEPILLVEPDHVPNAPAPKLPFREPAIEAFDEAPPLQLGAAPDAVAPIEPNVPDAPAPVVVVPAKNKVDTRLFANCEQIGSNVLFMRNPPEAFERAKAERKMVFIVHLSGNLEDKDFT